jgi:hypothetical protein
MILGAFFLASCEQDNGFVNSVQDSPNLALFVNSSKNVSNISDGNEYEVTVPIQLDGPTIEEVSGDVTVTIQPDFSGIPESERAEQGTNYRIDNNTITLEESQNYIGNFTFTMVTDGITAPKSQKINLLVTDISGASNAVGSGKAIAVTFNYACDSNIQGIYDVALASGATIPGVAVENRGGLGAYVTSDFGPFGRIPGPNNFTRGVQFNDVCGNLTVPDQNLAPFSNQIIGLSETQVTGNAQILGETTSFDLNYEIDFQGGLPVNATYTYVGPLQ